MSFPTNQSAPETQAEAWKKIMAEAGRVKLFAQQIRDRSAAGPVSAIDVTNYVSGLAASKTEIARLAGTPGLQAYAQAEYPGLNITTEYNTMAAQIDATVSWIVANYPKTSGTNELRERTMGADGRTTAVQFSSASLAGFRTTLDALIATLN